MSAQVQATDQAILVGQHFMSGDDACAEGAIAAGCRFFAGYPITPSSEIAERMARRLPQVGGIYLQMEDEIASMAAIVGASCAGAKAMTATSGPGFSLMQENIGLAFMTETPCVIVNVQRGGPSTGMPTLIGQADMMQVRFGSHGDYAVIAYAPASPQEMFDYTIKAFNMAERFRTPTFVMADELVGHTYERVVIDPAKIELVSRKRPHVKPGERFWPFEPDPDLVPPMALAGEGYRIHVTGLTHDERGYPAATEPEIQERMLERMLRKILDRRDEIVEYEEVELEDAEVVLIAYGSTARAALHALRLARERGLKVGMLRLITPWPFPDKRVAALREAEIIVPEVNAGQMAREIERWIRKPAHRVNRLGGELLHPDEILRKIEEVA
ncbi:MAG: 2-oxoacid:acceptor oxidoreductase subunit alpha [Candidatus Acetothermia bacterium]|jgi:2-oxoglutarate ferredoxin oxidoreductase subunit alpha|nr:2-oxoacid:acceptor oxidoreductase subunit alpha [Candidatus Acetothermia bacterium]MDH7505975.1 2-oxoacid:acceptor oxidoreductase subunit alpha [Candidatus Acetothermia bacterium]